MKDKIAVIDDHEDSLEILREALSPAYEVQTFSDPVEALSRIKNGAFAAVITDVMMPKLNGIELMRSIVNVSPDLPVILITAFGTLDAAANTIKSGAFDYLSKPLNLNEIRLVVSNAVSHFKAAKKQVKDSGGETNTKDINISNVVGRSERMLKVFKLIGRAAPTSSSILIEGESGTGKEVVARSVHINSPRADKPFIPISVAAIPEQLLEAELFGHEKGAFTGALFARDGLFTDAEGGTLFLDEVGEIPLQLQPKLLRVLQEHEVRRIGSTASRIVDVRIIAATNRNLQQMVREKLFREDLFYRLSVIRIELPPLRERNEDIPILTDYFVNKYSRLHNKKISGMSDELLAAMVRFEWPGNVRELENFIDRTIALATGPVLSLTDVEFPSTSLTDNDGSWPDHLPTDLSLDEVETEYIQKVLKACGNNYVEAAKILKINKSTLYRKLGRPQR